MTREDEKLIYSLMFELHDAQKVAEELEDDGWNYLGIEEKDSNKIYLLESPRNKEYTLVDGDYGIRLDT